MNRNSILCLIVASAFGGHATSLHAQIYEGFTQPVREIKVAASENGRLATVSVRRGDMVKRGTVLMGLDTSILEASRKIAETKAKATAKLKALQVELETKQHHYVKILELYESGAGSAEEVRRTKADVDVAQLNIESAKEARMLSQLELAEIEARIQQRKVVSPIAGVVTDVNKEEGEYVSLTEPHVVTVVQLDALRVTFFVPTDFAVELRSDQALSLRLPDTQQTCQGMIEHVGAVTKADSGRVRMDVLIPNKERKYRSGVRCVLPTK